MESILNVDRLYLTSAKTDVLRTFKRTGWIPPSKDEAIVQKWEYIRTAHIRNEEKLK